MAQHLFLRRPREYERPRLQIGLTYFAVYSLGGLISPVGYAAKPRHLQIPYPEAEIHRR